MAIGRIASRAAAVALLLCTVALRARADAPTVRAVLFYSPSCGHCHQVITEDLPPLLEKHGDSLQIFGVNAADEVGGALFAAAAERFDIPPENLGVPLLVVGETVLMGSVSIPAQFPALIEQHLVAGGVDWPEIPGLAAAIAQAQASPPAPTPDDETAATPDRTTPTPAPAPYATPSAWESLSARFSRDPVGNGLSVAVLAGMIAAGVWALARRPWRAWAGRTPAARSWRDGAVLLLCIVGVGVAGYLAYVETQQTPAVCGPVGDCNAVQQSAYARLFGLIPIGVLGVFGYLAILATWTVRLLRPGTIGRWAGLAADVMIAGGFLFSVYLTSLEPFVIGATCAWCLSSAVIMTLLLLISTARAMRARRGIAALDEATSGSATA